MHKTIKIYALNEAAARRTAAERGTIVSCREISEQMSTDRNGRSVVLFELVVYNPFPEKE